MVSCLPDKIHHFNVPITLENTIFQHKKFFFTYNVTFSTACGFLYPKHLLNHGVLLQGLRLERIIFRQRPTCLVTARPIITSSRRFTVAECLTHLAAMLEVMGSRPSLGDISEIYFLESIHSLVQRDLKWSV